MAVGMPSANLVVYGSWLFSVVINPDVRILDTQRHAVGEGFVMGGEHALQLLQSLEIHQFDAHVAIFGATRFPQTIVIGVLEIFDIALGREHREAFTDGAVGAESAFVFEHLRKLGCGKDAALKCLIKNDLQNDIALA